MCVPRDRRSLIGGDFDVIYDFIEKRTNLCRYVNDVAFRAWMRKANHELRTRCEEDDGFTEIAGLTSDFAKGKEMQRDLQSQVISPGDFEQLLRRMGLLTKVQGRARLEASYLNLCYHIGLLALDLAAVNREFT